MSNTAPNSRKDNVMKGLIIALAVVFVLAGVGYYAAKSGMSKADVEARLAEFNASLDSYGQANGYNARLTYDEMEIHGGIFNKKAELKNAEISVEPTRDDTFYRTMKIKSAKVEIAAGDTAFSSFTVSLPEPVTIISEEGTTQASFSAPLKIEVEREPAENGTDASYSTKLPASMTLTRPDESTAQITFGADSAMSGMVNLSASNYSHVTQITALKVLEEGETTSAASVNVTVESGVQDKESMKHQSFDVKELAFDGQRAALGKLNIAADMESEAPETANASQTEIAPSASGKGTIINTLKMEAADQSFAINAKGKITGNAGELLPLGELTVAIDKPKALIGKLNQAGIINPLMEQIAYTVLPKIDIAWTESSDTANFTLKRHAEQPLYIGDLSFEELAAQVLTGLLQQSAPAAGLEPNAEQVPATPEAAEPKKADPEALGIDAGTLNRQMDEKMQELEQQLKDGKQRPVTPVAPKAQEGTAD